MQTRPRLGAYFLVFVICLAADIWFLRGALLHSDVRAPAADIANAAPYGHEVTPRPDRCANKELTDWSYSIHSWQRLTRQAYEQGGLPLWNDRAGVGQPLIGNLQAEVFSPYLPLNLALKDQYIDWKQLAQLIVAQLGSLWLIWTLGLSPLAALMAAVGFSYGSYMQTWAVHPVAGSAAFAPAILASFLNLRNRFRAITVLGGGILIALSIFAGHIESTFMACMASCGVGLLVGSENETGAGVLSRLLFVPRALLVGVVGVCLAACQVFPFLDYLDQSLVLTIRDAAPHIPIPSERLFAIFDPKAFGFPTDTGGYTGEGNYIETTIHVGRITLVLAFVALAHGLWRRQRLVVPLFVLALFGTSLAFAPARVHDALTFFPFNVMPLLRMHFLGSMLLPVLAAFGVHALVRSENFSRPLSLTVSMVATVSYIAFALMREAGPDIVTIALLLTTGVILFVMPRVLAKREKTVSALLLIAIALVECQILWHPFVPLGPVASLSPSSEAITFVEKQPGDLRLFPSVSQLVPELGNLHDLTSLRTYDGMGMTRPTALYFHQKSFLGVSTHAPIFRVNPSTLDLLSVGWTLTDFPTADAPFPFMEEFGAPGSVKDFPYSFKQGERLEIFVSQPQGKPVPAGAIKLEVAHESGEALSWSVGDKETKGRLGKIHTRTDRSLKNYQARIEEFSRVPHQYFAFAPAEATPAGTEYTGKLTVADTSPQLLITVMVRNGMSAEEVAQYGINHVGRRPTALPRAYMANSIKFCTMEPESLIAKTEEERFMAGAIVAASAPGFDPHAVTLIESSKRDDFKIDGPAKTTPPAPLPLRRIRSGVFEIDVDLEHAGIAVFSECFARGWRAEIDGDRVPIVPANVCSMAVPVDPGKHTIRFTYWPNSLSWGISLSLATLLVSLSLVFRARWREAKKNSLEKSVSDGTL